MSASAHGSSDERLYRGYCSSDTTSRLWAGRYAYLHDVNLRVRCVMSNVIRTNLFKGSHKHAAEALQRWANDPAHWPQWKKDIAMSLGHPKEIFDEHTDD